MEICIELIEAKITRTHRGRGRRKLARDAKLEGGGKWLVERVEACVGTLSPEDATARPKIPLKPLCLS